MQPRGLLAGIAIAGLCWACQQNEAPDAPATLAPPPAEQPGQPEEPGGLAYPGKEPPAPGAAEVPGPAGPFVEPPLSERPRSLHLVVAGRAGDLQAASAGLAKVAAVDAVPVGYPAVAATDGDGYVILAGKFARKAYAEALAEALRGQGIDEASVSTRAYRHDRLKPSAPAAGGTGTAGLPDARVGRVFAGVAGVEVPLLEVSARDAKGTGVVADLALVGITERVEGDDGIWYRVKHDERDGYLPAARLLVNHNLFPSPDGRRGVLGVDLGCLKGQCRWDYWMVDKRYGSRDLLSARAERMPHAFSPDGKMLAYATAEHAVRLEFADGRPGVRLGPGTSPSWSPDGKRLYFRRPGTGGHRDEVVAAKAPDWGVETVLDFRGNPIYPKELSMVPPGVDMREGGAKLYTMFYRLARKDGGTVIHRWKVLFTPDGKIVAKKGEQIAE